MATDTSKYFLVLLLGIAIGVFVGLMFLPPQIVNVQVPAQETIIRAETFIPAITNEGVGTIFPFSVEVKVGTGKLLIDLGNLVFIEDTQNSIKKARIVASEVTGKDINNYDFIYFSDTADLTIIGGESAGAAITILTIAALENKSIPERVIITGAITENGSITKVGAVAAKAKAVGERGYITLLVPPRQSADILSEKVCDETDTIVICRQLTSSKVAKDFVENTVEVSSIYEALPYFGLE
ncbi:MAG: S16 family serine protease [Nanoarchaeota archaeon]